MSAADAAKKKGKKKAPSVAKVTKTVNAPVPQDAAVGPSAPLVSTIEIGKKFKGKVVGDVDVTGIRTLGNATGAADDLAIKLTAPSGRTIRLVTDSGDVDLGPWTLDDETRVSVCDAAAGCADPDSTLNRPFAGTSNMLGIGGGGGGNGPLSVFDGLRMRGSWTLAVHDFSGATTTSILSSWGLKLTAAKPTPVAPRKRTGNSPSFFKATNSASLAIPDETAADVVTPVTSTITIPPSFSGRVVGDVNVTGITTSGSAAGAANELEAYLVTPNGRLIILFSAFGDQSLGPWTFDDDTRRSVCDSATPTCADPDATLTFPFAGTSNLLGPGGEIGPLAKLNGLPMAGEWKLIVQDVVNARTSTLNSWGLEVTAAKPVKGGKPAASASAAAKKKGKKKQKASLAITKAVGQPVPQDSPAGASVPVRSAITISDKAFKGKTVGDLNVTGISTSGSTTSAANDLVAKLTAPNGRTVQLFTGAGDVSLGPWTLDDDVGVSACDSTVPGDCPPPFTLPRPFAGTTNLLFLGADNTGPLSVFNGSPIRGTWTFTVFDDSGPATTSTFNSWGLKITATKPLAP